MTTGPQSEWGRRADAVLRELFASLPIDTPEAEVRRRVTAAYPWGPRRHWPYKQWLRRARAWLDQRAILARWPSAPAAGIVQRPDLDAPRRRKRESTSTAGPDLFTQDPTQE
jgi:hypothetical protein